MTSTTKIAAKGINDILNVECFRYSKFWQWDLTTELEPKSLRFFIHAGTLFGQQFNVGQAVVYAKVGLYTSGPQRGYARDNKADGNTWVKVIQVINLDDPLFFDKIKALTYKPNYIGRQKQRS